MDIRLFLSVFVCVCVCVCVRVCALVVCLAMGLYRRYYIHLVLNHPKGRLQVSL